MVLKSIVLATAMALSSILHAQDSLLGKYSGMLEATGTGKNIPTGITIVISSVDGDAVKGVATRHGGSCRGEYPLVGTYKDKALVLRSTEKSGLADDCGFRFKGTVEGNALVGAIGQRQISLRK